MYEAQVELRFDATAVASVLVESPHPMMHSSSDSSYSDNDSAGPDDDGTRGNRTVTVIKTITTGNRDIHDEENITGMNARVMDTEARGNDVQTHQRCISSNLRRAAAQEKQ